MPDVSAISIARVVGAALLATIGMPHLEHFEIISEERRQLTSINFFLKEISLRIEYPVTLSTALCLPISSAKARIVSPSESAAI